MAIQSSLYFIFDNVQSERMGLWNVTTKSGMYEEFFLPSRSIIEQEVRGRYETYQLGLKYEPLEFPVEFAFYEGYTDKSIREVARWLFQEQNKPLQFSDNLDRIFYGRFIDDSQLTHNGLKEGYLSLKFRCSSPFAYTPFEEEIFDLSTNVSSTKIELNNNGDLTTRSQIWITKIEDGNISIKNYMNGGKELTLTGLKDGEEVYLDCKSEDIETSLPNTYRFDNHNDDWLDLVVGRNQLEVTGKCHIKFRFDAPLLQG